MNADQIARIRASFARLAPIADPAAALFYSNLFQEDPTLQRLFKGNMVEQGAKLMQMIGSAVGLLDKPQLLVPVLRQLGRRHGGYGVQPAHYTTVGAALMKTLEQGLGAAFDDATRADWAEMYGFISALMIEAAKEEVAAA